MLVHVGVEVSPLVGDRGPRGDHPEGGAQPRTEFFVCRCVGDGKVYGITQGDVVARCRGTSRSVREHDVAVVAFVQVAQGDHAPSYGAGG